ncbi:MAG: adenine-specific methyltransferase EcoRI family protein [Prevotella sp.]|nr:adenine-specific methyltransferase EcoRI family protein [Prevotella sp.]
MANKNLNAAKTAKKDEFYTQMTDIERELQHYWKHFRGKVVLCNCDDPYESNFFKYFALRFNQLGLKKLICTCYNGSPVQGNELMIDWGDFTTEPKRVAYKVEITEVKDINGDGAVDLSDVRYLLQNDKNALTTLKTGDFRDPECIQLLKQADIVVTNPPFSLFREYLAQLIEYDKKFVILGNKNAITYKEVFPFIMQNRIWIGQTPMSKEIYFHVPQEYIDNALANNKFRSAVLVHGKYMARTQSIWYTNLDIRKRHEEMDFICHYSPEEYLQYDNYRAIEVSKVEDIPYDYSGIMGVPITFLDKYNPEQFEILGASESEGKGFSNGIWIEQSGVAQPLIKGNKKYKRIFIRNKHPRLSSLQKGDE